MKPALLLALGALLGAAGSLLVIELIGTGRVDARRSEARAPEAVSPGLDSRATPPAKAGETRRKLARPRARATEQADEPSVEREARWEEVLDRLEAIEARLTRLDRRPLSSPASTSEPGPDLSTLIQEALLAHESRARERDEERRLAHEQEDREIEAAERRFEVGVWVAELAAEVQLLPEERDVLTSAILRMQEREEEQHAAFDPRTADPESWQREYETIQEDFWRELRRDLRDDLVEQLSEHF